MGYQPTWAMVYSNPGWVNLIYQPVPSDCIHTTSTATRIFHPKKHVLRWEHNNPQGNFFWQNSKKDGTTAMVGASPHDLLMIQFSLLSLVSPSMTSILLIVWDFAEHTSTYTKRMWIQRLIAIFLIANNGRTVGGLSSCISSGWFRMMCT